MSDTIENEIEFTHESKCIECGAIQLGTSTTDYTVGVDAKEEHNMDLPTDHDCQFEEHIELEEPIVQTVTYEA